MLNFGRLCTPRIQSFKLSGHAYSRSIRAHILSFAAPIYVLMDKLDGIFEEEHEDRLKNPYAKSSRLYLQQMEDLEKSMPTEEYTLFAEKGYFTIHRCDSFWSGNFSDQTELMRPKPYYT